MWAGSGLTAYRTKTAGLGARTYEQAQAVCNEWTGTGPFNSCGDWERLGPTPLTDAAWGTRAGGATAQVERTTDDTSTGWAATTTGRVHLEERGGRRPGGCGHMDAVDDDATTPNRFASSIYVDDGDGNHAWVSYSGFNANTPNPGHVFEVRYNPATGTSTWTNLSHDWGDLPVTDLVHDGVTGDLYAASDFGVLGCCLTARRAGCARLAGCRTSRSRVHDRAERADPLRRDARLERLEARPHAPTRRSLNLEGGRRGCTRSPSFSARISTRSRCGPSRLRGAARQPGSSSDERAREDRAEAKLLALLAEPAELVRMDPAVDRRRPTAGGTG